MSKKKTDELKMNNSVADIDQSIVNALVTAVRKRGGSFADFYRLTTPEGADDVEKIADVIVTGAKGSAKTFAELLDACILDNVDDRFNAGNFPLEPVADDEEEWEVYAYQFEDPINGLAAFEELTNLGYRLCGPRRAMEFIAKHIVEIQDINLFIMPVRLQDGEGWFVPTFLKGRDSFSGRSWHYLHLYNLRDDFTPVFDWLVLRKKKSANAEPPDARSASGDKPIRKRSFAGLLYSCHQHWVNCDFTEAHFPLEPIMPDESDWQVYEHHFPQTIDGLRAIEELEKIGYKLCGPRRAMEFVANDPDRQLENPLVATARWYVSESDWCVPFFGNRPDDERYLNLLSSGSAFSPDCGWLVLRKKHAVATEQYPAVESASGDKPVARRLFTELLVACKQKHVNHNFTEAHFPLGSVATDESEYEVYEYHFPKPINGLVARGELVKLGYRVCGLRRALEFVAEHPDIQLDHGLIVTVRWLHPDGDWCSPLFGSDSNERKLMLYSLDCDLYPACGWLVLRKKQNAEVSGDFNRKCDEAVSQADRELGALEAEAKIDAKIEANAKKEDGLLTVYDQSLGLAELIKRAVGPVVNYRSYINPDITQERFPLKGTHVRHVKLRVERFAGKGETGQQAVERLTSAGYTLAGTGDLAGFLHNYPNEVGKWSIVTALSEDSRWMRSADTCVPFVRVSLMGGRLFSLTDFSKVSYSDEGILVICD